MIERVGTLFSPTFGLLVGSGWSSLSDVDVCRQVRSKCLMIWLLWRETDGASLIRQKPQRTAAHLRSTVSVICEEFSFCFNIEIQLEKLYNIYTRNIYMWN